MQWPCGTLEQKRERQLQPSQCQLQNCQPVPCCNTGVTKNNFNPSALCSDRWPIKDDHWASPFPGIKGRLGPFHFPQRLIKTMKKKHIDCFPAINLPLNAVCQCNRDDCHNLLRALKDGTIGAGWKHSDEDVICLKLTKHFRQRCSKHLRKEMRPHVTICQMLDEWFV